MANAAREGRGQLACALQQRVQPDEEDGEVVAEGDLPGCGGQKVDEVDQLIVEVRPELLGREVHLGVVQTHVSSNLGQSRVISDERCTSALSRHTLVGISGNLG